MAKKKLSFEEAMERLEAIVVQLENEKIPLAQSLALYEEAMALSMLCREKLDQTEEMLLTLQKDIEGYIALNPMTCEEEQ